METACSRSEAAEFKIRRLEMEIEHVKTMKREATFYAIMPGEFIVD